MLEAAKIRVCSVVDTHVPIGLLVTIPPLVKKTRPCPEAGIIAVRMLMINRPWGFWEIPGILNICADLEPIARRPVNPYAASFS
jgi:hypothetical protein